MYRIHQIKLGLDEEKYSIPYKIKKKLHLPGLEITDWKIARESIDARHKDNIKLVYTVDFSCREKIKCAKAPDLAYRIPEVRRKNFKRPVIAGFGPCGMFCALILSEAGMRPIVAERGSSVEKRAKDVAAFRTSGKLNPESNFQFGEGGAGTFSDGKLTTGIKDKRIRKVLEEFAEAGAGDDILIKQHPHIGTDVLPGVVKKIREKIISLGGEVRFDTKLETVGLSGGSQKRVRSFTSAGGGEIETDDLVLAIGHSARDTFRMLYEMGIEMEQKPFSIGVRIVHPQSLINREQYGDEELAERLGAAEYKLSYHCSNGRGVYTFCMCPGGEVVVTSSAEGEVVTNGMSNSRRDGRFANSGLLTDVRTSDFESSHPLAGIEFQKKYEKLAFEAGGSDFTPPSTTWGKFRNSEVARCLPDFAVESICEAMPYFGRKLKGFDDERARMIGVETRSSSPVRILRGGDLTCGVEGLYPGGEGAGYAGGIVSAAVDGIRIAEKIIERSAVD